MKNTNRITRKMVDDALRARGRDESLRQGDGYFYFGGGEAVHWLSSVVPVRRLSELTVKQWLAVLVSAASTPSDFRLGVNQDWAVNGLGPTACACLDFAL